MIKMSKFLTRCICFFCISLFIFGCNKNVDTTKEQDKIITYSEGLLPLPEGVEYVADMCVQDNGSLGIIGMNHEHTTGSVWISDNYGDTWSKQGDFTRLIPDLGNNKIEYYPVLATNGAVFCQAYEVRSGRESYYIIDKKAVTEIFIDLPNIVFSENDEMEDMVSQVQFAPNGSLIITGITGQIFNVDSETGRIINTYLESNEAYEQNGIYLKDDTLYTVVASKLRAFNILTGEEEKVTNRYNDELKRLFTAKDGERQTSFGSTKILLSSDRTGTQALYLANTGGFGILCYAGDQSEKIVNGSTSIITGEQKELTSFIKISNTDFLILCNDYTTGSYLIRYHATEMSEIDKERLLVYSLEKNTSFTVDCQVKLTHFFV